MNVTCRACHASFDIPDDMAGMGLRVRCSKCQAPVDLQGAEAPGGLPPGLFSSPTGAAGGEADFVPASFGLPEGGPPAPSGWGTEDAAADPFAPRVPEPGAFPPLGDLDLTSPVLPPAGTGTPSPERRAQARPEAFPTPVLEALAPPPAAPAEGMPVWELDPETGAEPDLLPDALRAPLSVSDDPTREEPAPAGERLVPAPLDFLDLGPVPVAKPGPATVGSPAKPVRAVAAKPAARTPAVRPLPGVTASKSASASSTSLDLTRVVVTLGWPTAVPVALLGVVVGLGTLAFQVPSASASLGDAALAWLGSAPTEGLVPQGVRAVPVRGPDGVLHLLVEGRVFNAGAKAVPGVRVSAHWRDAQGKPAGESEGWAGSVATELDLLEHPGAGADWPSPAPLDPGGELPFQLLMAAVPAGAELAVQAVAASRPAPVPVPAAAPEAPAEPTAPEASALSPPVEPEPAVAAQPEPLAPEDPATTKSGKRKGKGKKKRRSEAP